VNLKVSLIHLTIVTFQKFVKVSQYMSFNFG